MGIVALVSGGVDSTLLVAMALEERLNVFPLFVDYGQLAAKREWVACRRLLGELAAPKPKRIDVSGFGKAVISGITSSKRNVYTEAFLPGRNALLLVIGASYAIEVNASAVAIGLLNEADHLFPDQTSEFLNEAEALCRVAMPRHIRIVAPLMHLTKRDVLALAKKRHIQDAVWCHSGTPTPCGYCASCREHDLARKET